MENDEPKIVGEPLVLYLKKTHLEEPDNKDFNHQMWSLQLDIWDYYYDELKGFQEHIYHTKDKETVVRLFVDEKKALRWLEIKGKDRDLLQEKLVAGLETTTNPPSSKNTQSKELIAPPKAFSLFNPSTWFGK